MRCATLPRVPEEDEQIAPWWMWAIALAIGATGVALAATTPGDFAYWLAPLLVLFPLWMLTVRFLDPWEEVPVRRRVAAWLGGLALAVAGVGLVAADPQVRSYVLGVLLLMPLVAVWLASGREEEDRRDRGPDVPDSGGTGPLDII